MRKRVIFEKKTCHGPSSRSVQPEFVHLDAAASKVGYLRGSKSRFVAAVLVSRKAVHHPDRVEAIRAEAGSQVKGQEGSRRPKEGREAGTGKTGRGREEEGRTFRSQSEVGFQSLDSILLTVSWRCPNLGSKTRLTERVQLIKWCLFSGWDSFYRRNKVIKMVINRGALINREHKFWQWSAKVN